MTRIFNTNGLIRLAASAGKHGTHTKRYAKTVPGLRIQFEVQVLSAAKKGDYPKGVGPQGCRPFFVLRSGFEPPKAARDDRSEKCAALNSQDKKIASILAADPPVIQL